MDTYETYKREFTKEWALKISRRYGCEPGKGGRGKRDDPLRRLVDEIAIAIDDDDLTYDAWLRYKAGRYLPREERRKAIHEWAVQKGYLGHHTAGGLLKRIQDAAPLMSRDEWEFDPEFEFQKQQDELWEQLDRLGREEKRIKKEKESLGEALGIFEQPQWLSPLERAEQLEREAAALFKEAAEIRERVKNPPRVRLRTVRTGCLTRFVCENE
ncbi:MAG: hypothetical protein QM739_14935 [Propionivibrio sp.]